MLEGRQDEFFVTVGFGGILCLSCVYCEIGWRGLSPARLSITPLASSGDSLWNGVKPGLCGMLGVAP